eukprot:gene2774-2712_t
MTPKPKFKSDALQAAHASAKALLKVGGIDKATLRQLDASCWREHVSQPVFALYLNTSESTIQKWETGNKQPSGMALKLLDIVQKHGLQVLT